jgi:predicted nucleotidyltransferase
MQLSTILSLLQQRDIKKYLNQHAIRHLWIVWSYARGNETKDSDIDIMVDVDEQKLTTDYFSLPRYLEQKLWRPIDLIDKDYINIHVKSSLLSSSILVW